MTDHFALEIVLSTLRAEFHARCRNQLETVDRIAAALEQYRASRESSIAIELAKTHGLKAPVCQVPPDKAAVALLDAVRALPELQELLRSEAPGQNPAVSTASPGIQATDPSHQREGRNVPRPGAPSGRGGISPVSSMGHLADAVSRAPLVIVGGPPHFERLGHLPEAMLEQTEWIDTTRQGTHAIGNLERRIREGRLAALVILEGLVQHRHSDPLVSAARTVGLPHGYGGKGGRTALLSALQAIDHALDRASAETEPAR